MVAPLPPLPLPEKSKDLNLRSSHLEEESKEVAVREEEGDASTPYQGWVPPPAPVPVVSPGIMLPGGVVDSPSTPEARGFNPLPTPPEPVSSAGESPPPALPAKGVEVCAPEGAVQ